MVDVDVSNRAGAVGGFGGRSFAIAQKRHFGSDPKRYHRHFDDEDEFEDGLVPQEHARHYREGGRPAGNRRDAPRILSTATPWGWGRPPRPFPMPSTRHRDSPRHRRKTC